MEKYILDRFEEGFAVLERQDGSTQTIEKNLLENAKEGDVVILSDGKYVVDAEETAQRRKMIEEKAKKVFGR